MDAQLPAGTLPARPDASVAPGSVLVDARVALTGRLALIGRVELEVRLARAGGAYVPRVTRQTTHLVVGMNGWPLARDGGLSGKLRRADDLRERGADIRVVTEEAFLELLGARPAGDAGGQGKSIHREHVLAATGIDGATLRRWEFAGLVRSHDDRYDFRDLVSLQAVAELVADDVQPETIARTVRGLSSVLPNTDRPLAQLRLVVEHGRSLLGAFADGLVTSDGQFVFAFGDPETGADTRAASSGSDDHVVDVIRFGRPPQATHVDAPTAEHAFDLGIDLEDRGLFADAEAAYREAVGRRSDFPEAHFNLGNALRTLGRPDEAEHHFRVAIAQSPDFAEAWFNLADLLDELDRLDDAVACLDRAVAIAPDYPDAHFNLARLLERQGRRRDARPHWRTYLDYDATSEWAQEARRHLLNLS